MDGFDTHTPFRCAGINSGLPLHVSAARAHDARKRILYSAVIIHGRNAEMRASAGAFPSRSSNPCAWTAMSLPVSPTPTIAETQREKMDEKDVEKTASAMPAPQATPALTEATAVGQTRNFDFWFLPIPKRLRYEPHRTVHFGLLLNSIFGFASTFSTFSALVSPENLSLTNTYSRSQPVLLSTYSECVPS